MTDEMLLDEIARALAADTRLELHGRPPELSLSLADRIVTVEGEVDDVRTKKLVLERVAAVPGVAFIVDDLRVTPSEPMGDDEIRDHVVRSLSGDTSFDDCAIDIVEDDAVTRLRHARPGDEEQGAIRASVSDGVVTLDGTVPSRNHARLACALAWWVPGTRDVRNFLAPRLAEPFEDGDLVDGVRTVLEKDPLVDADQVAVTARSGVVTLTGTVHGELVRGAAERDAWCVSGVDFVVNRIDVVA